MTSTTTASRLNLLGWTVRQCWTLLKTISFTLRRLEDSMACTWPLHWGL